MEQVELKRPGELVVPGDPLAMSEELLPGDGVFDDGTYLRAARFGKFEVEAKEMRCIVVAFTSVPATLQLDQYVLGQVTMLKASMAGVEVLHIEGTSRNISGDTNGTLHVSKISRRYVQDVAREYRLGDIVRCRVLDVKPSVQLSTQDPRCGAILAFCLRDRFPLKRAAKGLECPNCGSREIRNVAPDYGQVFIPAYVAFRAMPG